MNCAQSFYEQKVDESTADLCALLYHNRYENPELLAICSHLIQVH